MSITNPCFISYPHPKVAGSRLATFTEELANELGRLLDGFVPGTVYLDSQRLKPGYNYNVALQQAICESACMVVVYCPEYPQREYCRREFELMERIDLRRRQVLGAAAGKYQFIIPVTLTPAGKLPKRLTADLRDTADFSAYMALPAIGAKRFQRAPLLHKHVVHLSESIRELHELLERRPGFGEGTSCCGEALAEFNGVPAWEAAAPFPR